MQVRGGSVTTADGSLKAHAAAAGFLYGCAVDIALVQRDASYSRLVREQAGILVGENTMKWAPLRPAPDQFYFDKADALVAFAEENRVKVRGHNLCWHRQLPAWFAGYATPANASDLLRTHIEKVARTLRGPNAFLGRGERGRAGFETGAPMACARARG